MRLIAYYNELQYRITDIDANEDIYTAGNSPYDSQQYTSADDGVGLDTMKQFAECTGREIAQENKCEFVGVEYESIED